jgi:hypothetical protein
MARNMLNPVKVMHEPGLAIIACSGAVKDYGTVTGSICRDAKFLLQSPATRPDEQWKRQKVKKTNMQTPVLELRSAKIQKRC